MRAFALALITWTFAVFAWARFDPWHEQVLDCMKSIGHSPACEAAQAALNQSWWEHHTWPIVVGIAAGYLGIVLVGLAGVRARRVAG